MPARGPGVEPAPVGARRLGWTDALAEVFPFGLAPLLILVGTLLAAGYLLVSELVAPAAEPPGTLVMWTFARQHWQAYKEAEPSFEAEHPGTELDLQLVHQDAVSRRLRAAFWADLDVPDAVEVEVTRAGSFFRGPVEQVGFIDLRPRLEAPDPSHPTGTPLIERIVRTRLAPYTNRGRIFGLPHDVHPVLLAYRADLFEAHGIDPAELTTWDKFVEAGRRVTNRRDVYMLNAVTNGAAVAEILLFQRDGLDGKPAGYFDAEGRCIMDNEHAVAVLLWMGPVCAGPERIAADPGMFGAAFARAVRDGYTMCAFCPDWKSWSFQKDVPQVAGKMRLMPLPAWREGERRTSTWGGTMLGITRKCEDPDLAWDLARHLYLDEQDLAERFRRLNILPPYKDAWDRPAFHEPRPYWSGQPIGTAYIAVAEDVPPQYGSPLLQLAKSKLGSVVAECVNYYDDHGDEGYEAFVRSRLKAAADDVRKQMERNPF